MTKAQAISQLILKHIASGMTAKQAIDRVLGDGTHAKLASDVYDRINAAR